MREKSQNTTQNNLISKHFCIGIETLERWKKNRENLDNERNPRYLTEAFFLWRTALEKGGMDRNGSLLCDTRLIMLQITLFLEYKGKLFILSDCDIKKLKSDIWHDTELWLLFHYTKLNSRCEGLFFPPLCGLNTCNTWSKVTSRWFLRERDTVLLALFIINSVSGSQGPHHLRRRNEKMVPPDKSSLGSSSLLLIASWKTLSGDSLHAE